MLVAINQRVNAQQVGGAPAVVAEEARVPRLKMLMNVGLAILICLLV